MENIFLSIIVPICDGRLEQLNFLLKTFEQQDCDKNLFELVLIKNKILYDETKIDGIISNFSDKINIIVKKIEAPNNPELISESEKWTKLQGMNDARNLGIKNSNGENVFILDMDFIVMSNFVSRLYNFIKYLDKKIFVLYPKHLRLWDFKWQGSLKDTLKLCSVSDWAVDVKYNLEDLMIEFDEISVRFDYYYGPEGLHIMPRKLAEAIMFNENLGYRQAPKIEFQRVIKECGIRSLYEIKLYLFHIEHGGSVLERKLEDFKGKGNPDLLNVDYYNKHRRDGNVSEIKKIKDKIKVAYPLCEEIL